jgi:hypothetical protein
MKKITVKKWLIAGMVLCLWTSACYAQDSVKVKMICFEYDDSGSVVMEAFCNEEKEADVALNILINAMVRVRKDM